MSMKDYKIALQQGMEQYRADLADGVYPYLQVLEELTQNIEIVSEVPLGVCDISLDQVVGTNGHARSTSFAKNYMPLLGEDTEFAHKWGALSDIHLTEGIRDPIRCYEFMNRFYVVEGNKRISVLKYFGAMEFQGEVTRLIPRPDGSEASDVYQEFLKFYKIARINYINFTKRGSYQLLLEYTSRTTREQWDQDFQRLFRSCFSRFKRLYLKMAPKELKDTVSDAFLEYLKIYPFDSMVHLTEKELAETMHRMWASFPLLGEETPVMLQMQPEEDPKRSIVGRIADAFTSASSRKLNVALVYGKTPETSAWTYGHELGRLYLEETMKDSVSIETVEDAMNLGRPVDEILNELAEKGKDVIFTTTPVLVSATQRAAVAYPDTKFLNCSVNMAVSHIRTYYGRMYEAKFLCGLAAGIMTNSDKIAYVADYPISGMTASINAFARGVQLVNPRAEVYLVWSALQTSDVPEDLKRIGADIVSHQDFIKPKGERLYGVYRILEDGTRKEIAVPLWNWGRFYERILKSILSGAWEENDDEEENHSINYWWGLASGVVDVVLSDSLPEGVRELTGFYKKAIIRRSFSPFDGILKDQSGKVRSESDGYISTGGIVTMDWLLDNVVGCIPDYAEFTSDAQDLLRNMKISGEDSEGVVAVGTKREE